MLRCRIINTHFNIFSLTKMKIFHWNLIYFAHLLNELAALDLNYYPYVSFCFLSFSWEGCETNTPIKVIQADPQDSDGEKVYLWIGTLQLAFTVRIPSQKIYISTICYVRIAVVRVPVWTFKPIISPGGAGFILTGA